MCTSPRRGSTQRVSGLFVFLKYFGWYPHPPIYTPSPYTPSLLLYIIYLYLHIIYSTSFMVITLTCRFSPRIIFIQTHSIHIMLLKKKFVRDKLTSDNAAVWHQAIAIAGALIAGNKQQWCFDKWREMLTMQK